MVKYEPEKAAEIVGKVEESQYLSHSIRKIEQVISNDLGKHYRIITNASKRSKKAWIDFHAQWCVIWLPVEGRAEDIDGKKIRLTLAHELGHIFYNIEKLLNPETLNRLADNEEEKYAWEFAFHLIKIKSNEHENNIKIKRYIHEELELKHMFSDLIKAKKPEIYDDIAKSLNL
jgi:hypothetical protein